MYIGHETNNWSVASVFNPYGCARFKESFHYSNSPNMFRHEKHAVQEVANCIKDLGYDVIFGFDIIYNNYVITRISKEEYDEEGILKKKCYYGDESFTCTHNYNHPNLPLAGFRTIYEKYIIEQEEIWDDEFFVEHEKNIRDVTSFCKKNRPSVNLMKMIEEGSMCYMNSPENCDTYIQGASTIGNTLPNDIVEALYNFKSHSDGFIKEPDYEFYIPDCMLEVKCCPSADSVDDHGSEEFTDQGVCCPDRTAEKDMDASSSSDDET